MQYPPQEILMDTIIHQHWFIKIYIGIYTLSVKNIFNSQSNEAFIS